MQLNQPIRGFPCKHGTEFGLTRSSLKNINCPKDKLLILKTLSPRSNQMTRSNEQLMPPKGESIPKIYAYSIQDENHKGQLKIGQTTQSVKKRVAQQLKTAAIENYTIEVDEVAIKDTGRTFNDFDVRNHLLTKGYKKSQLEWMYCTQQDVLTPSMK